MPPEAEDRASVALIIMLELWVSYKSHPSAFNFASLWVIADEFRVLVVKPEALGSTLAAPLLSFLLPFQRSLNSKRHRLSLIRQSLLV